MTAALCSFQLEVRHGMCQTHVLCLPVAGKLPRRKRPGSIGQQLSEHEYEPAMCPGGHEVVFWLVSEIVWPGG